MSNANMDLSPREKIIADNAYRAGLDQGKKHCALDAARAREDRETEAPRPHVPVGGLSSAGASGSLPTPPRWFNDYQRREISNIALSEIGQSYGVLRATIADLEGKMLTITGGLHNAIDRVEASIDALARRLTGITAQHAELMGKVTALERGSASGATVKACAAREAATQP